MNPSLRHKMLIEDFLQLQEERTATYETLNRLIQDAEKDNRPCLFTEQMRLITESFNNISKRVISIKLELQEMDYGLSAEAISELQELEQAKLRLTADVHIKERTLKHSNGTQLQ